MITLENLKDWGACYFWDGPPFTGENLADWRLQHNQVLLNHKETLTWIGDGRTLREIALNTSIPPTDRVWVLDRVMDGRDWETWDSLSSRESSLDQISERYVEICLANLGDKADQ